MTRASGAASPARAARSGGIGAPGSRVEHDGRQAAAVSQQPRDQPRDAPVPVGKGLQAHQARDRARQGQRRRVVGPQRQAPDVGLGLEGHQPVRRRDGTVGQGRYGARPPRAGLVADAAHREPVQRAQVLGGDRSAPGCLLGRPAGGVGVAAHDQVVLEAVTAQGAAAVEQSPHLGAVEAGAGQPGRRGDLFEPQGGEGVTQRGGRGRGPDHRSQSVDAAHDRSNRVHSALIGHRNGGFRRLEPVRWGAMADFLTALGERVLLFDGAMGTQLMALHLTDEDFGGAAYHGCNEALVLTRPDLIEQIHRDYFAAGADAVETDSFTASRLKLDEYGLGAQTRAINVASAQIARRAAEAFSTPERPRFVAGSLGPTGMLISSSDPSLSKITFDELADLYGEQSRALIEGGVDLLLLETSQDLLEMKAAIAGITRAFAKGVRRVPIQAQATLDVTGRMLLGTDIARSARRSTRCRSTSSA